MGISKHKTAFGAFAKEYQKYRRPYNPKVFKMLSSFVVKSKNQEIKILDIGCGTGKSTEPLMKISKQVKVFGCDPDEQMLKQARISAKAHRLSITYKKGKAEKLPFENKMFDAAVSGAAFHWFATTKELKEIKRILKPNAPYFVFWTLQKKSNKPTIGLEVYRKYKWQGIPHQLRDPKYVKALFIKSGFKRVKTAQISFAEKETIPQIIGMIKTNSTYALLSSSQRKDVITQMTKAYRKALGKSKYILNKNETHICYGFK